MIYPFHCDKCKVDEDVTAPMVEGPPKIVFCKTCNSEMHRVWATTSVVIPEHMRASEDMHTAICNRMKHGSRPSGRSKTLW